MYTPIVDFVKAYTQSDKARFHMPGHKGVSFFGCESRDITEIRGADELYVPEGIILESERNAASLFGTSRTLYSAGGSTQSIHAMMFLAYMRAEKGQKPLVLAGRNAHKAFIYAAAKLDVDVKWLYPDYTDCLFPAAAGRISLLAVFHHQGSHHHLGALGRHHGKRRFLEQ